MASDCQHCSFVLLAEFDIDRGAQLTYQFPQPLGTDELLLANLMLPDGAEKQLEDWTIFFLNQTPFNTISPVLALEKPEPKGQEQGEDGSSTELLYVLNLVRTKHDKSVRRGAVVKAMAICTPHPFIQIFKPVLLMALDDYFTDPSQDCLTRLFDAVNAMDITAAPVLTRHEKLVMRCSERKDIFAEKFTQTGFGHDPYPSAVGNKNHHPSGSTGSISSFEEGILMRQRERTNDSSRDSKPWEHSQNTVKGRDQTKTESIASQPHSPRSDSSFSLIGNTAWAGDESVLDGSGLLSAPLKSTTPATSAASSTLAIGRGRSSTDVSSSSSHHGKEYQGNSRTMNSFAKDTHFYNTSIAYKGHRLPIKLPLSTFPEEVGDYSLIQLIQTFSTPGATISGPLHPHLHTNGNLTHPIIMLFNALVTGKRIIFLGHNRPAGQVASYVLSACALGSGCGVVLRGFIARAFPYANLTNRDEWESIPAYIAGVTNPIFESGGSWDLLLDVGSGRVMVSKDIHTNFPPVSTSAHPLLSRAGTLKAESSILSEDEFGRMPVKEGSSPSVKTEYIAKADSADNLFMEEVTSAISFHFGENLVRMRFMEYVTRFVRLSSRWEEDVLGFTKTGYRSMSFIPEGPSCPAQLGSGIVFNDDPGAARELAANASRIEAWRRTNSYMFYVLDFQKSHATNAIKGFDVLHQLYRLRYTKNIPDGEVELIVRTFAENVQSYEQVIEFLAYLVPHGGGLLHLSFGLLHQQEVIREKTVDIFNELRLHLVGILFLQSLNHFVRYAYVRQAHAREVRMAKDPQQQQHQQQQQHHQQHHHHQQFQLQLPPLLMSRTPSNRSESSLGI